ncbi:AmmeMemoRadiSam system protein B, partial [Microgenomates group bacterium]|nr:AmmeMemoRadiSam system protein B [Microgenomates group bacterium]
MRGRNWVYLLLMLLGVVIIVYLGLGKEKESQLLTKTNIRQPAVAGQFYPQNKQELETKLLSSLNKSIQNPINNLRILIVPHAGLEYSGTVAGSGFSLLKNQNYQRVILLGVSHTQKTSQALIDNNDYWQTSLGQAAIDQEGVKQLIDGDRIKTDKQIHEKEHSLEMELIFLQQVLTNFKIIPILLGEVDVRLLTELSFRLAGLLDQETLLVISTDLSHYLQYGTAAAKDKLTIDYLIKGNLTEFEQAVSQDSACAYQALRVGLKISEILGINWQLLDYKNSGDV